MMRMATPKKVLKQQAFETKKEASEAGKKAPAKKGDKAKKGDAKKTTAAKAKGGKVSKPSKK